MRDLVGPGLVNPGPCGPGSGKPGASRARDLVGGYSQHALPPSPAFSLSPSALHHSTASSVAAPIICMAPIIRPHCRTTAIRRCGLLLQTE